MEVIGFTDGGLIEVLFTDGSRGFVPDCDENADRQKIAKWEAAGNIIPPPVPVSAAMSPLTARQLRLGLVSSGISLDQVEAAIAAMPDAQTRSVARIEWEYASQFFRDHPLISTVGKALGLPHQQIDEMWAAALAL